MPIDVAGKVKGETITDLQVVNGSLDVPQGTTGSTKQITVVLGNGTQLIVRGFCDGSAAFLRVVQQRPTLAEDEQILD